MKRFLKLNVFALVALLFLGVADAWGLGINKNVALNLEKEGGNGSWDGSKLSWIDSTWNLYKLKDWDDSDLSGYDKMVINVSNATQNKAYRVVITIDGTLYTYTLLVMVQRKSTLEKILRMETVQYNPYLVIL